MKLKFQHDNQIRAVLRGTEVVKISDDPRYYTVQENDLVVLIDIHAAITNKLKYRLVRVRQGNTQWPAFSDDILLSSHFHLHLVCAMQYALSTHLGNPV